MIRLSDLRAELRDALQGRKKIDWLEVKWPQPGGKWERFTGLPLDRYVTIMKGAGSWK